MVTATRNHELLNLAKRVFPGGTLGEFRLPPEVDVVFARAAGTRMWDVDGTEYIDFLIGSGPLIVGHAHPALTHALIEQAKAGTSFFGLNEPSLRLAERLVDVIPCAEQVRFALSGTEAFSYAVRSARAFTGRSKILRFEGRGTA